MEQSQKGYQSQLQKCEERLRKNAKSSCQMKLYCQYLEDQLKSAKSEKKKCQKDIEFLTTNYNKQIQTLKTELSNAAVTKRVQYDNTDMKNKPADILTKIKTKLLNMGGNIYDEPKSCINTFRKNLYSPLDDDIIHQSEPVSKGSSPKVFNKKNKVNQGTKVKKGRSKSVCSIKQTSSQKNLKKSSTKSILKKQSFKK